ncbi:MAG: PspC domain-containing protein [Bacteroidota bacterium]
MKRLKGTEDRPQKSRGLRLIRSKGSITGVSAGLAEYFGIEVRNVRIAIAALTAFLFFTGGGIFKLTGFAIYGGLAALLSREGKKGKGSQRTSSRLMLEEEPIEIKESPEIEEALLLCPNCNTVSKPNSLFCHNCGTRL